MKTGQHVLPHAGVWAVRRAGAARVSGTFATQKEAIERATQVARSEGTEIFIHGRDGRIRERNSFGRDPFPPKD